MGLILLKCLVYALIGLVQEMFIIVYHRATGAGRRLLASMMTVFITVTALLVTAQITHQMMEVGGLISLCYVVAFACGKGIGAYVALGWWDRVHGVKKHDTK